MIDMLNDQLSKFNERIKNDEKLRKDFERYDRTIQIVITDGVTYHTHFKDFQVDILKEGSLDNPDIVITSDEATLRGLINKEINPIKAFLITKKLKIEASLEDKLRLRKLFD